jgi:hypothetical protein
MASRWRVACANLLPANLITLEVGMCQSPACELAGRYKRASSTG